MNGTDNPGRVDLHDRGNLVPFDKFGSVVNRHLA